MFSLGHSTIVVVATILVAICSAAIGNKYEHYHEISGFVGATISAAFLIIVGMFNVFGGYLITKKLKEMKMKAEEGVREEEQDWQEILNSGGPITRLLGKHIFAVIDKPYKVDRFTSSTTTTTTSKTISTTTFTATTTPY